jgi:hypothetical protein
MKHRYALLTAVVATFVGMVTVAAALPARPAVVPVRIMPLGDSITAGPGCWRAMLWNRLQTTGYTDIDFVGGVSDGGGCNPGYTASPYALTNETYNNVVGAGGSVTFGFLGNWTGTNANPTASCTRTP